MTLESKFEEAINAARPINGPLKCRVTRVYQDGDGYLCDVNPCFYDGKPNPKLAEIRRIKIDPLFHGNERGFYALPKKDGLVRVGFYENDPNLPFIDSQLGDTYEMPWVKKEEVVLQHSLKSFFKFLATGAWTLLAPLFRLAVGKEGSEQYILNIDPAEKQLRFTDKSGNELLLDSRNGAVNWLMSGGEKINVDGPSQRSWLGRDWMVKGGDNLLVTGLTQWKFLSKLKLSAISNVEIVALEGPIKISSKLSDVEICPDAGKIQLTSVSEVGVSVGSTQLKIDQNGANISVGSTQLKIDQNGVSVT